MARVNMDLPDRSMARLELLKERTESASYVEVVRNALRLYEALTGIVADGGRVFAERDGVRSEILAL